MCYYNTCSDNFDAKSAKFAILTQLFIECGPCGVLNWNLSNESVGIVPVIVWERFV